MLLIIKCIDVFSFSKKKILILKKHYFLVLNSTIYLSSLIFNCFMLCDGFDVLCCSVLSFSFFLYK